MSPICQEGPLRVEWEDRKYRSDMLRPLDGLWLYYWDESIKGLTDKGYCEARRPPLTWEIA